MLFRRISIFKSWTRFFCAAISRTHTGFKMASIMDVIVIGCGAAGIAAIRKLHNAGLKVMGLEAADRIGGRIHTVEFGNGVVDIGAAWCHGEKDNIVFDLANPLDLLGRPDPSTIFYVQSNGDLVPESVSQDIVKAIADQVENADKKGYQSILECVKSAIKSNPVLHTNPELTNSFIESYAHMNHLGGQNDPTHGKSLRGLEEHWVCEGEFMLNWKGKGYKMILDVLLNKYPDPSKEIPVQILLNKEVESIRWGTNNQVVASLLPKASNPLVQVKCKDGSLYAAKSVIVTVSIGVLKERHAKLFNPPLPAKKVTTINSLQLAVLDKIYIEFEKPWWPKTPSSFVILWTDEDKAKFEETWITEIFALDTVTHQPNLLRAWLYGNGAEAMEKVSLEEIHDGVNKLMNKVLKKNFDVTPVKSIVRSQWASNPLARGSYSYRSVLTEQNGGDGAILLSEPLYFGSSFPVVCFAGEATSHHRFGMVHGAIESGFREAERLIESFKTL